MSAQPGHADPRFSHAAPLGLTTTLDGDASRLAPSRSKRVGSRRTAISSGEGDIIIKRRWRLHVFAISFAISIAIFFAIFRREGQLRMSFIDLS